MRALNRTRHVSSAVRYLLAGAVVGFVSIAGASAQIGYEARTRFALGHGDSPTPITEPIIVSEAGTVDITLQMGIFNAQGFENYGVGFWSGSIFATEPLLTRPAQPRVAPFDGPFGFDGNVNEEGTRIGIPGERLVEPTRGETVYHYNQDDPVPGLPPPVGAEEFVNLYRFSITISDLSTEREIVVRAEGNNWPLEGFFLFQHVPPDPDTGEPGYVWWSPDPAGNGVMPARPTQLSLVTILVIPGPGAGMAVGIAGIGLVSRRRR